MILNIIDRRKRPYRFKTVNAIIEPTRHDNCATDSDKASRDRKMDKAWLGYDQRERISLQDAISWAARHKDQVTLYLYDKERGLPAAKRARNG